MIRLAWIVFLVSCGGPKVAPTGGDPYDDADHDAITGTNDKCPDRPEDKDGFEDEDGCPEDNPGDVDQDGFADAKDSCPKESEDFDNFMDDDGCPEPDNDKDGVLDADDKCPEVPEDKDGDADEDGCPDGQ